MGNYIDELINSNVANISAKVSRLKDSVDLSKFNIGTSVSSDKVFESVSKGENTSNIFGVFDSKQVVQELAADTNSVFSTELIDELDPDKLKSTAIKLGSEITSDFDFESAVGDVMSNFSDLKTKVLSSDDFFGSVVNVINSDGAEIKATLLESVSLDDSVSSIIPGNVSTSDFDALKTLFNDQNGFGNFNTCDILGAALGFASSLIDINSLFGNLRELFALLAKYDITGILSCITEATNSMDMSQMSSLGDTLIQGGAIGSFSEFTALNGSGTIVDKYNTAYQIGASAPSNSSPTILDSLFTNMGISDKTDVLAENIDYTNDSILTESTEPIYSKDKIDSAPDNFSSYCFSNNGVNDLIKAIPSTLFS
jgi:hypothetical protein